MPKEVIIIGGGHSVKEGIEKGLWDKIKGKEIWSLNFAFMTMPYYPSRELWIDTKFFTNNFCLPKSKSQKYYQLNQRALDMVANKVEMHCKSNIQYANFDFIQQHPVTRTQNLFETPNRFGKKHIYNGSMGLCGFFALSLAVLEGYETIYLLGYDFGSQGGLGDIQTHFYQAPGEITEVKSLGIVSGGVGKPKHYCTQKGAVKPEVRDFEMYTKYASKIYNVSLVSNIHCFERISFEDMFSKINLDK